MRVLDSLAHGGESLLGAWCHPGFDLFAETFAIAQSLRQRYRAGTPLFIWPRSSGIPLVPATPIWRAR